ncbi:Protein-lysine N-methyltransferase efm4 [Tilletia horrida]|nr:Protein-lysine N-methyltransferase efm4 [Tilletia horrida]KAK0562026.1 Protein-lysine N-methyltransferase efm4 [Tilletia horrida]
MVANGESSQAPADALPESKLGTKAHWDQVYERELTNWEDHRDEGEVWFGEEAVDRMVNYLERALEDQELSPELLEGPQAVLDLGMGNGHLLFALHESPDVEVEPSSMLGVDYSPASVSLAGRIGEEKGDGAEEVRFEHVDLMDTNSVDQLAGKHRWGIVCDKGTLDAIALSSQPIRGVLPVDLYTQAVDKLTRPDGIFLVTSCNFTKEELIRRFSSQENSPFEVEKVVPAPSFTFGGQTGSSTTTISFRRRKA